MPAKFEVRDGTDRLKTEYNAVEVQFWPRGGSHSMVWAMSTDDARDLYVTLGTFLEDE